MVGDEGEEGGRQGRKGREEGDGGTERGVGAPLCEILNTPLSLWSYVFQINFRVRQGSVLSPVLFAIYVDDVARCCKNERYLHLILYADDILLLAPSVTQLEKLLRKCEEELNYLDMVINVKKSEIFGPRYDVRCKEITTSAGNSISWANQMRYLGVFQWRN